VPLYLSRKTRMSKTIKAFKEGISHMAVVCVEPDQAHMLRNLADKTHMELYKSSRNKITEEEMYSVSEV